MARKGTASIGKMIVHGVEIESRYSDANEICEMMNFLREMNEYMATSFLSKVFYDGKSSVCSFEFWGEEEPDFFALKLLELVAKKHITQFEIRGRIGHGYLLGKGQWTPFAEWGACCE